MLRVLADIGDYAPLIIPVIIFMIPIVAILTSHQRKMAEILHGKREDMNVNEIHALRYEMQQLRELVHQQSIQVDNLVQMQLQARTTSQSAEIQARLDG